MISFLEAREKILSLPFSFSSQTVSLSKALGCYLYNDLLAPSSLPLWNNSAMDGYAFRWDDFTTEEERQGFLPIAFNIAAGQVEPPLLPKGTVARIMTGAPMPHNADTVVMQENVIQGPDHCIQIQSFPTKGRNVRIAGEEISRNDIVIPKGTRLGAAEIGLCASLGITELTVFAIPMIGIIATGDELQIPGTELQFGEIWSSNTLSLQMALRELGFDGKDYGIARDNLSSTKAVFKQALEECDIILSTGGVSVGDFDVVKDALDEFEIEMEFWKVRMKPGKPIAFGSISGTPIFALPGNPVSAMTSFYQFLRPFLLSKMHSPKVFLPSCTAVLEHDIQKKNSRLDFQRVIVEWREGTLYVRQTGSQSSAWISSLVQANALLPIAADCHYLEKGSTVVVELLP